MEIGEEQDHVPALEVMGRGFKAQVAWVEGKRELVQNVPRGVDYPTVFRFVERELIQARLAMSFSLTESSLEQVFLEVSRMQPPPQEGQFA